MVGSIRLPIAFRAATPAHSIVPGMLRKNPAPKITNVVLFSNWKLN